MQRKKFLLVFLVVAVIYWVLLDLPGHAGQKASASCTVKCHPSGDTETCKVPKTVFSTAYECNCFTTFEGACHSSCDFGDSESKFCNF